MKRFAKSACLTVAKRRGYLTSSRLTRLILGSLKFGFAPPPDGLTYPGGSKASCVISIDFDHLTKSPNSTASKWIPIASDYLLARNREGTSDLLALSEKYRVPMTWAICGRTAAEDRQSYEMILHSSQPQEVGIHTYSHIDVSGCSEEELETDLQRCLEVLKLPVSPKTFIFPWNRQGHFEILEKFGFETYREQARSISYPRKMNGLWNISPTYYVDTKSYGAQNLIKKYLDLCLSWRSVFHLWFHPWSVIDESIGKRFAEDTLDPIFSYLKEKKDSGDLALCTMGQLASFFQESQTGTDVK